MERIFLGGGYSIPQLGLGTYGIGQSGMYVAIKSAIENGISLFDTSPNYKNDSYLMEALKELAVHRNEYQIITKIDSVEQLYSARKAVNNCLKRMNIEYIDLYLMHWPHPKRYLKIWKEMEQLQSEGVLKRIGVCNFMPHHMEPLLNIANEKPCVNQIELHPLFTQSSTVEYCKKQGIQIMSYTPLARMDALLIRNPFLESLANKYSKTVQQIILRWNVQRGFCVIPKSSNPARIRQNADIFDFEMTVEEIDEITNLNINKRYRFDPDDLSRYPKKVSKARKILSKIKRLIIK
jgi:diketogulonate reductase-like aldo/keto reductase